jgi:CubicO group peptidase (beta-lactamase class C family)
LSAPGGRGPGRALLLALAVFAIAVLAPWAWRWYQAERAVGPEQPYQPTELLVGGNEPPAPHETPEQESLDRAALEAAATYAGEHDSLALIVSRHGYIVFERYWRGSSYDTPIDAQSLTRLLPALATGVAISHRLIGWPDEPIGAFISEWAQDARGNITVRDLLQSASGLASSGAVLRGTDLVGAVLALPLESAPGTHRVDQGADPQLLALVLERASKERFAQYLSRVLWRRIGAADAQLWLDRPGGTAHADCCLRAHQGDWIRVAQLLLRDGNYGGAEVIRPGWVTLMRAPGKADPDYGAYLRVGAGAAGAEPYALPDVFVVAGAAGHRLWLVPQLELAILCTTEAHARDARWDDGRIPNLIIRGARDYLPSAARPGADLSKIVPGH